MTNDIGIYHCQLFRGIQVTESEGHIGGQEQ
jgi:hypothetical protein